MHKTRSPSRDSFVLFPSRTLSKTTWKLGGNMKFFCKNNSTPGDGKPGDRWFLWAPSMWGLVTNILFNPAAAFFLLLYIFWEGKKICFNFCPFLLNVKVDLEAWIFNTTWVWSSKTSRVRHVWKGMLVTIAGFAGYKASISTGTLIRIPLQLFTVHIKGCDFFEMHGYFVMDLKRTEQKLFIQQT